MKPAAWEARVLRLLLATVCLYQLKESAERNQLFLSPSNGVRWLRRGLAAMAAGHITVTLARLLLESVQVYPAAIACLPAVGTSFLVFVLLLAATTR